MSSQPPTPFRKSLPSFISAERFSHSNSNSNINNSKLDEINTIRDELLEMDESSHVVVINSKSNSDKYSPNVMHTTKELVNHNNIYGADDLKTEFKLLPSSSTSVPQRNHTKYGIVMRPKRIEHNRLKLSTTSEKTLEESDLYPYLYFGQKLSTIKATDPRNNVSGFRKIPFIPDFRDTRYRDQYEEKVILRPTTEKVKFYPHRHATSASFNSHRNTSRNVNIVAFNNAHRRAQTALVSQSILPTTLRPTTLVISETQSTTSTSTDSTPNLESSFDPSKILSTRSTNTSSTGPVSLESVEEIIIPHPMEINHNLTADESRVDHPIITDIFNISDPIILTTKPPLLTIVPDDAPAINQDQLTPENKPQEINIPIITALPAKDSAEEIVIVVETTTDEQEVPATEMISSTTTTQSSISESTSTEQSTTSKTLATKSTTPINSLAVSSPTHFSLPDINNIFSNISTLSPISSSTSTSIIRKISSSSTTLRNIIPDESSSLRPVTESVTARTNQTLKPFMPEQTTSSTHIPMESSTIQQTTTSTTSSRTNESNQTINKIFNISAIFSLPTSLNRSLPIIPSFDEKEAPLPNTTSDVAIEIDRINMATYALVGIGLLPVILILLYLVKSFSAKKSNKVSDDLEKYIQEGQPISPVVRLDQSETSSVTDESIVTDRDFNRNKLRFKSLLGEGNFGQVWKAEVDDLAGHMGTTRIVAVKAERSGVRHSGLRDEAHIMRKLGSHSNVVTLLGACVEQG